jgi:hypothetical protein
VLISPVPLVCIFEKRGGDIFESNVFLFLRDMERRVYPFFGITSPLTAAKLGVLGIRLLRAMPTKMDGLPVRIDNIVKVFPDPYNATFRRLLLDSLL